jgi:sulfur carrier protein ThiS
MRLRVRLFGTLGAHIPGYDIYKGIEIDIADGSTVEEMLHVIGLTPDEARVVLVKGVCRRLAEPLEDLDEVSVFQPIGGG